MADNFLERHRQEYEKRKAEWLRKKRGLPRLKLQGGIARAEDEAL
uniref:Dehydrogenase n=1 Tax=Prevotella sp. GTC17262 TaxID=3236797 RepID=A0AB33JIA0_9BACT